MEDGCTPFPWKLRSLLGMFNYFNHFIEGFSTLDDIWAQVQALFPKSSQKSQKGGSAQWCPNSTWLCTLWPCPQNMKHQGKNLVMSPPTLSVLPSACSVWEPCSQGWVVTIEAVGNIYLHSQRTLPALLHVELGSGVRGAMRTFRPWDFWSNVKSWNW